jgi:lipooligosaccharide transport system permease protein
VQGVLRQYNYWATVYRRTWKGNAVSSFLQPLLYLVAMGFGLGGFIADVDGVSYLEFLAAGVMAATAMQTAIAEATYPVMAGFKWQRFYYSMIATPLTPADVTYGQLGFIAFRVATTCAVFGVVAAALGGIPSWLGVLTLPVALLVGMAYATPVMAIAARLAGPDGFAVIFRLGMLPMFLFSGVFFPVSQLPDAVAWLAYLTPLWHGVELSRGFALGEIELLPALGHTGYLLVWFVGGCLLAVRSMTVRLVR